jgi:hypothetical protein
MQYRKLRMIVAFLAACACSSFAQKTSPEAATGIEGVITISPSRPGPAREGISNSVPVAGTAFSVQNEKGVISSFTTDNDGRFRLLLKPGHYSVSPKDKPRGIRRLGPWDVDVVAGKITRVEWQGDSGMR